MDNMQNGGMTSNFPWLSKEQIERLEQVTANLTGTAKIQAQQKLYQSALQQLKQNEVKDNRVKTENELYYKSMDEKDPKQQNYLQSNVRLEQLADLTKNKFWLKQDANTKDVLSGLMQYAQDQGVSLDSLNNYLDSGDESFLYDMGLKEQTPEEELEETTGEKIADVWVGFIQSPWKRGYNMIGQWMDRLWKRGAEQLEGSALQKRVQEKAIDLFWEDEVKAYQESVKQAEENWTTFNGREATDIRTPLLWEERANSAWTKWGEIAWDIATWIWVTAPMAVATAPIYASSTALWAWILWASEGAAWTLLGHYGAEWDLNISPTEALLGVWGGAVWGKVGNWLANKGTWIRKEAEELIAKSIKPTVKWKQSQTDYNKFIDYTMDVWNFMSKNKGLLQYTDEAWDVVKGKLPTTMKETREAVWNLKKTVYDVYNWIAQKAGDKGARVNLNNVIDKLDELGKDVSQNIANPNTKNVIERYKNALKQYTDEAGTISIEDAQKITQIYNQKLTSFFRNPNMNDVSENAIIAQMNKGIKDWIDESIETAFTDAINKGSVKSQEYQKLKSMYGKIKTVEDEVAKRALVEARKNAKGLSQTIIDSLAGWEFTQAILTANPIGMAKAWTMNLISKWYNYINSPDTNIRKLFKLIDKENGKLSKVGNKLDDVANATDNVETKTDEIVENADNVANKTDRELSFEKLKTEDDVYNYAQTYKNDILEEYAEKKWGYINPDDFRDYINNNKKIQASETHKWASYLAEEYFNKLLKEHPNGKGIVVAWWPWGWKWTSIDRLKIDQQGADILVDKTKGNKELKKMLENGMSVDYYVVVPDTEKIVSNIIGRAARAGELWRWLPINSVWIPTHKEVASVVTDLYKNGSPSWKFNLKFIDNTGEIEQINLKEGVEWFKLFKKYSKELNNITPERVQKEADQWLKDWKITQKQHDELIKGVWWIILVGSLLWATIDGENEKEQV